ncbi:hypothetical protein PPIS_b1367 [Pseudoalteromonas piscicida]|uniref:Phosphatidate cytidylyltransferase n=1 Tax=Pseudoalteromonas piscicida TaxID=43662 RepID=A0ABM6NP22_PSEO7|nr:hypothetical protein PPIS_b1367 [Pseudoalteromonas piscicida]
MKTLYRIAILLALLIGVIAAYSYSSHTGMFIFVILGVALEIAFWLKLIPRRNNKT